MNIKQFQSLDSFVVVCENDSPIGGSRFIDRKGPIVLETYLADADLFGAISRAEKQNHNGDCRIARLDFIEPGDVELIANGQTVDDLEFKNWWHEVGSGLRPLPGHDHEEHAARIAELAWLECYKIEHLKKSNENDNRK